MIGMANIFSLPVSTTHGTVLGRGRYHGREQERPARWHRAQHPAGLGADPGQPRWRCRPDCSGWRPRLWVATFQRLKKGATLAVRTFFYALTADDQWERACSRWRWDQSTHVSADDTAIASKLSAPTVLIGIWLENHEQKKGDRSRPKCRARRCSRKDLRFFPLVRRLSR